MEGYPGMGARNCEGWLNIKISQDDKDMLGRMSVERDMSMSAICRQLIKREIEEYVKTKESGR